MEQCLAVIFHGAGHQSRTLCQVGGKHRIHKAIYGEFEQEAEWLGDEAYSGYFDEAPIVPEGVSDNATRHN